MSLYHDVEKTAKGNVAHFLQTARFIMKNDDGRITAHDAPLKISLVKFKYGVPFVLMEWKHQVCRFLVAGVARAALETEIKLFCVPSQNHFVFWSP